MVTSEGEASDGLSDKCEEESEIERGGDIEIDISSMESNSEVRIVQTDTAAEVPHTRHLISHKYSPALGLNIVSKCALWIGHPFYSQVKNKRIKKNTQYFALLKLFWNDFHDAF